MNISIKTPEELVIMAEGGGILARTMKELEKKVRPGITAKELEGLAESLVSCPPKSWAKEGEIKCSFKGYQGFPSCLCASVNEEIVHVVPSNRAIKKGDILSLDFGIFYKGFHTDMAITLPVGKINRKAQELIKVTKKALEVGIKKVKPGNRFGDISRAIQKYVEGQGFNVVRELCGHGIGREVHEKPQILNSVSFDKTTVDKIKYQGEARIELKKGMVFCLEPMVVVGDWRIKKAKDGFGFETKDGSLSCHFEHTVAVTKSGAEILTLMPR